VYKLPLYVQRNCNIEEMTVKPHSTAIPLLNATIILSMIPFIVKTIRAKSSRLKYQQRKTSETLKLCSSKTKEALLKPHKSTIVHCNQSKTMQKLNIIWLFRRTLLHLITTPWNRRWRMPRHCCLDPPALFVHWGCPIDRVHRLHR